MRNHKGSPSNTDKRVTTQNQNHQQELKPYSSKQESRNTLTHTPGRRRYMQESTITTSQSKHYDGIREFPPPITKYTHSLSRCDTNTNRYIHTEIERERLDCCLCWLVGWLFIVVVGGRCYGFCGACIVC